MTKQATKTRERETFLLPTLSKATLQRINIIKELNEPMRVFVKNMRGKALMPTTPRKARVLLKEQKARVVQREPFTIQLKYATGEAKQPITLGIDAGSKTIGASASTEKEELCASETILRNDIVNNLSSKRQYRRSRRSRKTRYRKPRFLNRVHSKKKGWLAPSIEQKIGTHERVVKDICTLLPVNNIVIETAQFDTQKLENPAIKGTEYQNGVQKGHWNVREYVLFRDNHTCQYCKGKSKDPVLNTHHIESRKTGGNRPENLLTLCQTCHQKYHQGGIELNVKRGVIYKHPTFMGIMRWTFYKRLKERYELNGVPVQMTFGYLTKQKRIHCQLKKMHRTDAYCIAGNLSAKLADVWYRQKKVRCHNRQLHKAKINKGHVRKNNQASYEVKGYRLFDKVRAEGEEWLVFGRRKSGYFDLRKLDGEYDSDGKFIKSSNKLNKGNYSYKKIELITRGKSLLTERQENGDLHLGEPCISSHD